jgi:hypothetical protein
MSYAHLGDTMPKARKDHVCDLCELPILKGTIHMARRYVSDGVDDDCPGHQTFRMHLDCEVASRAFDRYDWEECRGDDFLEFKAELEAQKEAKA